MDLANDQSTPITFFAAGTLDMPTGGLTDFLDWWLVLRDALDVRPLHRPGRHDLPEIELPTQTGDVTVHLSCTLHMSQAPEQRERRVMYTSFRLPAEPSEARKRALARIRAVREGAPTTVSQESGAAISSSSGGR